MLEVRGPAMATGDYGTSATIDLYRKDLALIAGFASEVGAAIPS
jgi:3-hydroxyisobutyrate dehydrogenase-like beta-hydroxyacid dehydrogenase